MRGCRVCGVVDGTRSHILPASMVLDARGDNKHLHMGTRFADGNRTIQSGIWDDDILCLEHEKMLGDDDKAAVEFCRRVANATLIIKPANYTIGGVDTDALVRFVASVLWRCSVSDRFGMQGFNLGGAVERKLAAMLFQGTPVGDFPGVTINGIVSALPDLHGVIHYPKVFRIAGTKIARFVALSSVFTAEIGPKPYRPLEPLRINGKQQVVSSFITYEDTPEYAGSIPVVAKMGKPRSGWPMRQKKDRA